MNRRSLLIASTMTLGSGLLRKASSQSTPVARAEVALSHGTVLVDYQLYGESQFVGEVVNRSQSPTDTPIVGLTAFDHDGNIISSGHATPVIPVTMPGASSVVMGRLDPPVDDLSNTRVEIYSCSDTGSPTFYTDMQLGMMLTLEDVEEDKQPSSYVATSVVRNEGAQPAENVAVYGVFRDKDGRIAGGVETTLSRAIPPGKTMVFRLDVGVRTFRTNDPFDLVSGDYSVDLRVGVPRGMYFVNC